jgi:hypothetical protein
MYQLLVVLILPLFSYQVAIDGGIYGALVPPLLVLLISLIPLHQ